MIRLYHFVDLGIRKILNFKYIFLFQDLDWKDLNATDPEFVKSVEKCEAVRRDDIR